MKSRMMLSKLLAYPVTDYPDQTHEEERECSIRHQELG